jgi:hypothetical protein
MTILSQVLISFVSSATLVSVLAFVVKKYLDKYISYHFDRRLGSQQAKDAVVAELKKLFFAKSVEVYAETFRLAFRCLLAGRTAVGALAEHGMPHLSQIWEAFHMFQIYLENQVFIDARDYRVIHTYKNNFEQFCVLCQALVDKKQMEDAVASESESQRLVAFWRESVEPSFSEVQGVVHIFSVKDDARD